MKKPGSSSGRRNKAEEALRLDESRLEALLKLDEMADAPLQGITRFAMEQGVRLTNSRIGYLAFMNEDETVLTMHSWSRIAMAQCRIADKPLVYPLKTVGLWGEAVRQRKPVVTNDYPAPNPWKKGYPSGHVPVTRHMNVPVFDGKKIVVVAGVGNKREPYDDSDVRQLQLLMDGMWRLLQRKRTAEALRQNEEKFKRLIETTGTGYVILDDQGRVADANLEYVRMTGRQRLDEILGRKVLEWTAPHDLHRNEKAVKKCLAQGHVRNLEITYVTPGGQVIPIEINATVLRSAGTVQILTMCRDITERKRAEEALQRAKDELEQRVAERTAELSKSRERLSTLFRTSPAGIFLSRLEDGLLLEVNDAYRRLLGYTAQEMVGRTTLDLGIFVNPDDRTRSIEILKRDGRNENLEVQYRHKSGRIVHLLINALPVNVDGVPCILGTSLDITERKRAEEELKESKALVEAVVENVPLMIFLKEAKDLRFVIFNRAGEELLGYDRKGLLGKNNLDLFPPEQAAHFMANDREVLDGEANMLDILEEPILTAKKGQRLLHTRKVCIRGADGTTKFLLGISEDITERKRAEEELKDANLSLEHSASRLRSLTLELTRVEHQERQRIAGLLHDHLQQLLVAAKLHVATLSQDELEERQRDSALKATAALDQAIAQSRSLTMELNPPVLREGGLAHALRWLGRRMRQTHDMEVQVEAQGDGEPIDQDSSVVLFNAVRELLLNVLKHANVKSARVEMSVPRGRQVRIVVSDRGSGFARKVTGSANDPESGLGLLAIRERLESLGGAMELESRPGQGSRITLTAPRSPSAQPAKTYRASRAKVRAGRTAGPRIKSDAAPKGIRVLLVDDHAIVRQGVAQLLSGVPEITVVAEASNGKEAVQLTRKWRPDVVVMDVNMPEMNGVEATRSIHARWPGVSVIGLSMYHEPHRAEEMRQAGAAGYVNKSEVTETLISTIRACCKR